MNIIDLLIIIFALCLVFPIFFWFHIFTYGTATEISRLPFLLVTISSAILLYAAYKLLIKLRDFWNLLPYDDEKPKQGRWAHE